MMRAAIHHVSHTKEAPMGPEQDDTPSETMETPGRSSAIAAAGRLGDFIASPRIIFIAAIAIVVGALSACVALILLRLIGLFTNLFFFQRWSTALVSPAGNTLGPFVIIVPVVGAL